MTREEAIKIVRNIYQTDAEKEALATLIPELAESEDEMSRKWILEYLYDGLRKADEQFKDHFKAAIAYLEKQKEREDKLYEKTKDRFYKEGVDDGILIGKEQQKEQKPAEWEPKPVEWEWPNLSNCIKNCKKCQGKCFYRKESYEEQKPAEKLSKEEYVKKFKAFCDAYEIKLPNREYDIYGLCEDLHKLFGDIQNPAEWSDEDEAHRDFILESLEDQIRFCKKDAEGAYYAKQIRTAQNWLKFLSERFNLEPKQEWSEEDKVMLNNIIWGVHMKSIKPLDEMDDRSKYERYEDFLKALPERFNLQPRQEWSEEDEQTFIKSVETLEYLGKFELADWLKEHKNQFLKPQNTWKPSEEEIGALAEAMERNDKIGYLLHQLHEELKHNYKL